LISFRYHLVSIVAVFLALAVGVVMGTTVVKQGVVDQLKTRTDNLVNQTHTLQREVADLQTQLKSAERFIADAEPLLLSAQLADRQVVMLTVQGVDPAEVDGVRRAFDQAGATVVAVLEVTARMAASDPAAQRALAAVLGAPPSATPESLVELAGRSLGNRLSTGPPSPSLDAGSDLLQNMVTSHLVDVLAGAGNIPQIGTSEQALVVLAGGGQTPPPVDPQNFLVRVVQAAVDAARPVVAAETATTAYPFVPLIRENTTLDHHMVTVDDADLPEGRVAIVLGLRNLFATPGQGGDYGSKPGASSLLPKS
jgi:putative intracellular protease/amidase